MVIFPAPARERSPLAVNTVPAAKFVITPEAFTQKADIIESGAPRNGIGSYAAPCKAKSGRFRS